MSRKRSGAPISLFSFQDAITSVCGVVVLVTLLLAVDLTRRVVDQNATNAQAKEKLEETRREIATLRANLAAADAANADRERLESQAASMSLEEARRELERARERLEEARQKSAKLDARLEELEKANAEAQASRDELDAARAEAKDARRRADDAVARKVKLERTIAYKFPNDVSEVPWFVELVGKTAIARSAKIDEEEKRFESAFAFTNWARSRPRGTEYFVMLTRPSGIASFLFIQKEFDDDGIKYGVDLVGESTALAFVRPDEAAE